MKRILIVGGGVGGTILANNLSRRLASEVRQGGVGITLLSASERHMYQPGLLYVALGRLTPDEIYRDQRALLEPGIEFHVDPAEEFQLDEHVVTTRSGARFSYDFLVIATGSRPSPELIPGLAEHAHHCYTEEGALKLFQALRAFEGGRVLISTAVPHKCPMVPLELAFLVHEHFQHRGLGDKVRIHYTYPINRIHSLENVARWAAPEFDRLGISYETLFNIQAVDGAKKRVLSEEGEAADYDLLIAVPPHRGMAVIEENGLGKGGWIPTHRGTLRMEGRDNVYVLGDTTNIAISKAGSTAHYEAEVLGENLAAQVRLGADVTEYTGKVFCFIEAGERRATYASFDYTHPPRPQPPTQAVHWFKMAYNKLYWNSIRGLL